MTGLPLNMTIFLKSMTRFTNNIIWCVLKIYIVVLCKKNTWFVINTTWFVLQFNGCVLNMTGYFLLHLSLICLGLVQNMLVLVQKHLDLWFTLKYKIICTKCDWTWAGKGKGGKHHSEKGQIFLKQESVCIKMSKKKLVNLVSNQTLEPGV